MVRESAGILIVARRPLTFTEDRIEGLYDMHGNLGEWCQDWSGSDSDSQVIRGGSWVHTAENGRSASRNWYDPGYRFNSLGFRPVLRFRQGS
ncbi:MAG: SUMF1/EgtB/PvdO family nonheme iron enzyme [Verrucomicrobiota bacterium]